MTQPSKKQVNYAIDLSNRTGITIPKSVLEQSFMTNKFIQFANEEYKKSIEYLKAVPIEQFANYLGEPIKRQGTHHYSLVYHDSVMIDTNTNLYMRHSYLRSGYHSQSANPGGSIFDFAMEFGDAPNFREAYKIVKQYAGYECQQWSKNAPALAKKAERKDSLEQFVSEHRNFISRQKHTRTPLIINVYGEAGSGKAAACHELCTELKGSGYIAEYVPGYPEDLVNENKSDLLDGSYAHQIAILKEQVNRIDQLYRDADLIVTDSPILMNPAYNKDLTPEYSENVRKLYSQYKNFSIFMERGSLKSGEKIHTPSQPFVKNGQINELLMANGIKYLCFGQQTVRGIAGEAVKLFESLNPPAEIQLPSREKNMYCVFAYLNRTRKIDRDIIEGMVKRNMLYQGTVKGTYKDREGNIREYSYPKNCIFVSYYKDGVTPAFASYRGTNTYSKKRFLGDCLDNDEDHGFYIYNNSDRLIVTESVIDAMSIMNILHVQKIDHKSYDYMVLTGSASKSKALIKHLKREPKKEIYLAADNDVSGKNTIYSIAKQIGDLDMECDVFDSAPPEEMGKDWNEAYCTAYKYDVEDLDLTERSNVKSLDILGESKKIDLKLQKDMRQEQEMLRSMDNMQIPNNDINIGR